MRASVPSFVIPGTWLENLRWLEANTGQRRVELLFFSDDEGSIGELRGELPGIRDFAGTFRFSAHLPDRLSEGHAWLLEEISPWVDTFVVHPPIAGDDPDLFAAVLDGFRRRHGADRFFLENTRLDLFDRAEAALARRAGRPDALPPPPLCADAGHLVVEGVEPAAWIGARRDRIRELHLHGVDGGRDHRGLRLDEPWLLSLKPFLAAFDGIVELEMFSWEQAAPVLDWLAGLPGTAPRDGAMPLEREAT